MQYDTINEPHYISAKHHRKYHKELQVPKKHTPIDRVELAKVLKESHFAAFEVYPSKKRLAISWAQVALENGHGKKTYNHNLGNISTWGPVPHYIGYRGQPFRSFDTFLEGGTEYWKVLQNQCPKSLKHFDQGQPVTAAYVLRACNYYVANKESYAKAMSWLYNYALKNVLTKL